MIRPPSHLDTPAGVAWLIAALEEARALILIARASPWRYREATPPPGGERPAAWDPALIERVDSFLNRVPERLDIGPER